MNKRRDFVEQYRSSLDERRRAEMIKMQAMTGLTDDNPLIAAIIWMRLEQDQRDKALELVSRDLRSASKHFAEIADYAIRTTRALETLGDRLTKLELRTFERSDDPTVGRIETVLSQARSIQEALSRIETRLDHIEQPRSLFQIFARKGKP